MPIGEVWSIDGAIVGRLGQLVFWYDGARLAIRILDMRQRV